MTSIVFVGPSLPSDQAVRIWSEGVSFRPPAACGDVYGAVREKPAAIGLIDGFFDQKLAVWHKEILWALHQGVRVYGGASLGALRAAELADFGMVGVGRVFEWFQSGALEDDDEVAIAHEAAERGYRPCSDAMVNIRATLESAQQLGVIGEEARVGVLQIAKSMFYTERTFQAVLSRAERGSSSPYPTIRLRQWLAVPEHRIDLKRRDAALLLGRMRGDSAAPPNERPSRVRFRFAYTEAWHELTRRLDASHT